MATVKISNEAKQAQNDLMDGFVSTQQVHLAAIELNTLLDAFANKSEANALMVSAIRKSAANWHALEERPWLLYVVRFFVR